MSRLSKYNKVLSPLNTLETKDLITLIVKNMTGRKMMGITSDFIINDIKVFAKVIPVTDVDIFNMYDTANIHNLPLYYNYGIGSAGFGCWRELNFHIKASNWVLNKVCVNFPILYHHRIVKSSRIKMAEYVYDPNMAKRWNRNKAIEKYTKKRSEASHFVILCLEYFPSALNKTLNDKNIQWYLKQANCINTFLRKNKVIHFDPHPGNFITDGKLIVLTDYGLVLDKKFNLSEEEIDFFDKHTNFCSSYIIGNLLTHVRREVLKNNKRQFEQKYNVSNKTPVDIFYNTIFDNLDEIGSGWSRQYIKILKKYRNDIVNFNIFMSSLMRVNIETPFPNKRIKLIT
jgi:tRNA A-37 threonylcarbamoyl transferase component Bud32